MITGGLGYIIPMLINLIFTPLLVTKLGQAAYGLQSLVNVVIGYLMVADMGLDIPVIKYVAQYSAKKEWNLLSKVLTNTFQIYIVIGKLRSQQNCANNEIANKQFCTTCFKNQK